MTGAAIGEAAGVVAEVFSADMSAALCDLCVHTLLPLRPPDLAAWAEDPEAFYLEQASLSEEERCALHF